MYILPFAHLLSLTLNKCAKGRMYILFQDVDVGSSGGEAGRGSCALTLDGDFAVVEKLLEFNSRNSFQLNVFVLRPDCREQNGVEPTH